MSQRTMLLFDLDGTLLPMDREEFIRAYLPTISAHAKAFGDPKEIGTMIWQACLDMFQSSDGSLALEEVFWRGFSDRSGIARKEIEGCFEDYYHSPSFDALQSITPPEPLVPSIIEAAKLSGCRMVLATSPLFPRIATEKRVCWAGLSPDDFELITTFEDFHTAKPHKQYYEELLAKLEVEPHECVMIGNDAREDLPAPHAMGMETFLLLNHAIIPDGFRYHADHQGKYEDLLAWLKAMPQMQVNR